LICARGAFHTASGRVAFYLETQGIEAADIQSHFINSGVAHADVRLESENVANVQLTALMQSCQTGACELVQAGGEPRKRRHSDGAQGASESTSTLAKELELKNIEIGMKDKELEKREKELVVAKEEAKAAKEEVKAAKEEVQAVKEEVKAVKEEVKAVKLEYNNLQATVGPLAAEKLALVVANTKLQGRVAELEHAGASGASAKTIKELKNQVKEWENKFEAEEKECGYMMWKVEAKDSDIRDLKKEKAKMETKYIETHRMLDLKCEEMKRLEDVYDRVKNEKLNLEAVHGLLPPHLALAGSGRPPLGWMPPKGSS
jgi:predicted  nucleic acid-binding Zn-ribbon protein